MEATTKQRNAPARKAGRHFLQIPGPSNVPDRILRAIDKPTIDHRGPEFATLGLKVLAGLKTIFRTDSQVLIFPGSGTGAWEAAMVNLFSPGDRLLMVETGQFAVLWRDLAQRLGLLVEMIPTDWRHGADPRVIEAILAADTVHAIKGVCIVHNDTSTGLVSPVSDVRGVIDRARHPALLLVDAVSSLGAIEYRHDDWGVDVTVSGSQKGLMLPPGLGFNAVSAKALEASRRATMPRAYWDWAAMLKMNATGFFPYTPATNLLYGLAEAIDMLHEEGLENIHARHHRHGEATRRAVRAWGLEIWAADPAQYSDVLTAVLVPEGHDADRVRQIILDAYDLSLGAGLGKVAGRVFRIGHLGDFNDLMLAATLAGVEMGLELAGVPHNKGGVAAALDFLTESAKSR